MESLESRKKNLALTLLYYLSQELWLGKSRKLICTNQSRFYNFSPPLPLKKKKKIALFLDISQVKIFLSFTRQHSWMCIRITRINNFNFKTKKKDKNTKSKRKKQEKRISVKNLTGYNDILCEFVLCSFDLLDRVLNFSWLFI